MYSDEDDLAGGEDLGLDQVAAHDLAGGFRGEDVQVRVDRARLGRHEVALQAEQVERPLDLVHRHPRLGDGQAGAGLDVAELDVPDRADRRDDGAVLQPDHAGEAQQLVHEVRAREDADDEAPALPALPVRQLVHAYTSAARRRAVSTPGLDGVVEGAAVADRDAAPRHAVPRQHLVDAGADQVLELLLHGRLDLDLQAIGRLDLHHQVARLHRAGRGLPRDVHGYVCPIPFSRASRAQIAAPSGERRNSSVGGGHHRGDGVEIAPRQRLADTRRADEPVGSGRPRDLHKLDSVVRQHLGHRARCTPLSWRSRARGPRNGG